MAQTRDDDRMRLRRRIPTCKHAGIPPVPMPRQMPVRGYFDDMITMPMSEARRRLGALARLIEAGETIVVTRNGRPVFDLVPHRPRGGINLDALEAFKREHGLERLVTYIADDFDDPLREDFLLQPLPEKS